MFSDDLAPTAAAAVECPIRKQLTLLAAGLDIRFLHAGTTLSDAVGMIDRIINGLDGVIEVLDEQIAGAAVTDLVGVADTLTALPADQAARGERMSDVADIAGSLRQHVLDMHQTLRVLRIYGMNIKVAASGEEQFVGFVDGMNDKLASGEQQLGGVLGKLKDLHAGLADVQQVDRLLAAESLKVVPDVPRQLTADAAGLKAHLQGVSDLAQRVGAIARSVQEKIAILLGALQVGDSTRQRLEHVVSAMQMVETHDCGQAASAHVYRLLAAQLGATVQDFSRETAALIASLEGLVPDAQGLLELILEQSDDGGRAFMLRLEASVSGIDHVVLQLDTAHDQARSMTTLIATTVADLATRVRSLGNVRLDVQDIATNTRLLCRRHGTIGRAVSVVATEVDAHARGLGETMQTVVATIDRLARVEVTASGHNETLPSVGEALGGALGVIRQACQRTERVVLEGGDDAQRLVDLLQQTVAELLEELSLTGVMEEASTTLLERAGVGSDTPPADEQVLRLLLPEIGRLYTMAQERDVHRRFLLPGMEAAYCVEPIVDDDDDGLF